MNAGKRRKLIRPDLLVLLAIKTKLGIPLTRAMQDLQLDGLISRPAAAKLISLFIEAEKLPNGSEDSLRIQRSLAPEWLDLAADKVQEQPAGWVYSGFFPIGEWQKDSA